MGGKTVQNDINKARSWLLALSAAYTDKADHGEEIPKDPEGYSVIDALEVALSAVAPPEGTGHSTWIDLPSAEKTPYEHIGITGSLLYRFEKYLELSGSRPSLTLSDIRVLISALQIYRTVLATVNADRIKEVMESRKGGSDG